MHRYYSGLTSRMLSEIETISEEMSHAGEKGRNNEAILVEFLRRRLPNRYTVSTGKVVATGAVESGQIDVIIHDRLDTPAFVDARAWSLVPVESVHAVVSVKTRLTKQELRDAMGSLASVRCLPRRAATIQLNGRLAPVAEDKVIRPRAFVFAYKSSWSTFDSLRAAFIELLGEFDDDVRPNAVCALDQAFVARRPYTVDVQAYGDHALLHFFLFLVKAMDSRPRYRTDLTKYFTEDYGQSTGN